MAVMHVFTNGSNTFPYASKLTASTTIQNAIDRGAPGDTIIIHGDCAPNVRCVYKENVTIRSTHGQRNLQGSEWPIVDGRSSGPTIRLDRVLARCTIEGLEIINGVSSGDGGGINVIGSVVTIRNNCIHNNRASGNGGGIAINQSGHTLGSQLEIHDNHIHHNNAIRGGGIVVYGPFGSGGRNVDIQRNVIGPQNQANKGAGIHISRGNVLIKENHIHRNHCFSGPVAARGAGVHASMFPDNPLSVPIVYFPWSMMNAGQVVLEHNLIRHNTSEEDGAAVASEWGGGITLKDNWISRNVSHDDAGAIYCSVKAQLTFVGGNTIYRNQATNNGGAIHGTCTSRLRFTGTDIVARNLCQQANGGGISIRNAELLVNGTLLVMDNGAPRGLGGGISILTEAMTNITWKPCEMDASFDINGAIVYQNSCGQNGGGIAVTKGTSKYPRGSATIRNCIIMANTSTGSSAEGIYFGSQSHPVFAYTPQITGNLIDSHRNAIQSIAVFIESSHAYDVKATINNNTITNNTSGIKLAKAGETISGNLFQGQSYYDFQGRSAYWHMTNNHFNGAGTTANAITDVSSSTFWSHANNNNITGHSRYGFWRNNYSGTQDAENCWWGHANGPTLPGGPANGDRITAGIDWTPQAQGSLNLATPIAPGVPTITIVRPPRITFGMPSEFFNNLKCDAQ